MTRRLVATTLLLAVSLAGLAAALWASHPFIYISGALGTTGIVGLLHHRWYARPLDTVTKALEAAAEHGVAPRLAAVGPWPIRRLIDALNRTSHRLVSLSAQQLDATRELDWAQERLKLQGDLERANRDLAERVREQEILAELAVRFASSLDIAEVLRIAVRRIALGLGIDEVAILLVEPTHGDLVVAAAHGLPNDVDIEGLQFAIGEGVTAQLWATGEPVYVPDIARDARYLSWKGRHTITMGSLLAVVIEVRGRRIGLLDCIRRRRDGFLPRDIALLRIVASQAAVALRNAQLYAETRALATHDELTKLSNRRRFFELLDTEWTRSRRFDLFVSVLVIDVDRFKDYNDRHGHLVGDEVLAAVAAALAGAVRETDVVARYGGEEFVVLLPATPSAAAAEVAEKLRQTVTRLGTPRADMEPVHVSIGVATGEPARDEGQGRDLVSAADHALLRAKTEGRDRVVVAHP